MSWRLSTGESESGRTAVGRQRVPERVPRLEACLPSEMAGFADEDQPSFRVCVACVDVHGQARHPIACHQQEPWPRRKACRQGIWRRFCSDWSKRASSGPCKGRERGYVFAMPPEEISLLALFESVEERAVVRRVSPAALCLRGNAPELPHLCAVAGGHPSLQGTAGGNDDCRRCLAPPGTSFRRAAEPHDPGGSEVIG